MTSYDMDMQSKQIPFLNQILPSIVIAHERKPFGCKFLLQHLLTTNFFLNRVSQPPIIANLSNFVSIICKQKHT